MEPVPPDHDRRPVHAQPAPPGTAKLLFIQRLGPDWRDLADWLEIPLHEQNRFTHGDEARDIWAWLERRVRLARLPDALRRVKRHDLADELSALKSTSVPCSPDSSATGETDSGAMGRNGDRDPPPFSSTMTASHLWEKIAAFAFGVAFLTALLTIALFFPDPTPFQYQVFRIILALAGAGVAAVIPGLLDIHSESRLGMTIRAGGALAVFVLIYLVNPAQLIAPDPSPEPVIEEQVLEGTVWGEHGDPLAGVQVILPAFGRAIVTDDVGRFSFQVTAPRQDTVELLARKDGYRTHDQYATLGNEALSFTLEQVP